jgi:hypothetical protein
MMYFGEEEACDPREKGARDVDRRGPRRSEREKRTRETREERGINVKTG